MSIEESEDIFSNNSNTNNHQAFIQNKGTIEVEFTADLTTEFGPRIEHLRMLKIAKIY